MKTKLLLLLLLGVQAAFGQLTRKNTIGISSGKTFFGTGDIRGYNITATYERELHKRIFFEAQLGLATGQSYEDSSIPNNVYTISYKNNNSQKLNAGVLIAVVNHRRHLFGIHMLLGGLRTTKFRYGGYSLNPTQNPPQGLEYIPAAPFYKKELSAGFGLGVAYKLQLTRFLQIGAEGIYQQYANGDVENTLNLGLYHSF